MQSMHFSVFNSQAKDIVFITFFRFLTKKTIEIQVVTDFSN